MADRNQTPARRTTRGLADLIPSFHHNEYADMVSNSLTNFPHARSFVLKLHSDAAPAAGLIVGRLDHVISGRQFVFHSAEELVTCLAQVKQASASTDAGARS